MFCKYCGSEIKDDALFCAKCGRRVNEQAAAQNAMPTEQTAATNNTNYAQTEPIAPTQETEAEKRKKRRNEILTSVATAFFITMLVLRCMVGGE